MFCFHKWGTVENDRQMCSKCGIARNLPCQHKWKGVEETYIGAERDREGKIFQYVNKKILMQCTLCGEFKTYWA